MRTSRKTRSKPEEPDLTPALDIVFILLIFFIVAATFQQEKAILVEPPNPIPTESNIDTPTIVVELGSDGSVFVNGKISTLELVRGSISRERAETPDASLVISVDQGVKSSALLRVRDAAYSAGYHRKVGVIMNEAET